MMRGSRESAAFAFCPGWEDSLSYPRLSKSVPTQCIAGWGAVFAAVVLAWVVPLAAAWLTGGQVNDQPGLTGAGTDGSRALALERCRLEAKQLPFEFPSDRHEFLVCQRCLEPRAERDAPLVRQCGFREGSCAGGGAGCEDFARSPECQWMAGDVKGTRACEAAIQTRSLWLEAPIVGHVHERLAEGRQAPASWFSTFRLTSPGSLFARSPFSSTFWRC